MMDTQTETGLFTLGGALGGALLTGLLGIGASWINNRKQIEIERIKSHESETAKAYQTLFDFSVSVSDALFPMCSVKREEFEYLMKKEFPKIKPYRIYFSKKTNNILDKFADTYECSFNPDLVEETEDYVKDFIEEKGYLLANELREEIENWQQKRGLH